MRVCVCAALELEAPISSECEAAKRPDVVDDRGQERAQVMVVVVVAIKAHACFLCQSTGGEAPTSQLSKHHHHQNLQQFAIKACKMKSLSKSHSPKHLRRFLAFEQQPRQRHQSAQAADTCLHLTTNDERRGQCLESFAEFRIQIGSNPVLRTNFGRKQYGGRDRMRAQCDATPKIILVGVSCFGAKSGAQNLQKIAVFPFDSSI